MDFPFVKEAVTKLFSKPSCNMYPAVPSEAAPGYRGRIVYHPESCIDCGMCERVCAGGAITKTVEETPEGKRITRTFDLGSCTFCGTCADFCSRHSIELTQDYHMIGVKDEDLLVSGTFVKAPPKKPAPKPPAPKPEEKAEAEPDELLPCPNPDEQPAAPAAPEAPGGAESAAEPAATAKAPLQPRDDGKPVQDPEKCVYCTLCAKNCPAEALTVERAEKTWTLDEDKCIGCGSCAGACPKDAILL